MSALFRGVRFAAVATLVALGVLALFLPGNLRPEDGPADPLLEIRRPVLVFLRQTGVMPQPAFIFSDPWLPSGFDVKTWEGDAEPREAQSTIRRTPVYRGLLWRIGMRVCCTERDDRYLKLRFTAVGPLGERRVSEGPEATGASAPLTVEGFAPNGADEWVLEGIDAQGVAHEIRSESSTPRP